MQAIFKGVLALEAELDKLAELGVHVRSFSGPYPTLMIQPSCRLHPVLDEPQGRLALNVPRQSTLRWKMRYAPSHPGNLRSVLYASLTDLGSAALSSCLHCTLVPLEAASCVAIFASYRRRSERQASCLHAQFKAAACAEVHFHGQDGELRQHMLKHGFAEGAIYIIMPHIPESTGPVLAC